MSSLPSVVVTETSAGCFRVELELGGSRTEHEVQIPDGLVEELAWASGSEAALVRASFDFLLRREPPGSILPSFSLEVIGHYFPEYPDEMRVLGRSRAEGSGEQPTQR